MNAPENGRYGADRGYSGAGAMQQGQSKPRLLTLLGPLGLGRRALSAGDDARSGRSRADPTRTGGWRYRAEVGCSITCTVL